ncbi:peptidase A22B, signal peptide peptidase [Infundibulicybe gibba]|nr:peptidase A22B, signal peptide peptidase [Infundibulicybe gibba]
MDTTHQNLLLAYSALLSLATGSIYAGAYGSLPNPKPKDGEPPDDDDQDEVSERMSSEDAWWFPVIGSVALFGLYLIVKFFGREWINWFLGWYFSIAGVGSVWKTSISLTRYFVGNARWKTFSKFRLSIKKDSTALFNASCRTPSLYLLPVAAIPSILYTFSLAYRRSFVLTDILALSFSHNALCLLKIDSFKTGTILLSGLFFYDIWWVFGTEVMVKVATTLDVPIKLLWPKSLSLASLSSPSVPGGFTMLGLGDIVIPGTFVALALRYDYHRSGSSTGTFAKPYFYASLTAYFLGLVTTMFVMHTWKAAQPALLYLSPACIMSFLATAIARGELLEVWQWSDDPQEIPVEKKDK